MLLAPSVIALGAALAIGASCGDDERTTLPPVERPPPTFRLLVVTDLHGYLEPCGCTSRPLGGIDRLAARVASLREGTPTVMVVAGDVFFGAATHGIDAPGAETQEIWKGDVIADVLARLDVDAVTPGALDLSHGVGVFAAIAQRTDVPMVAANVRVTPPVPEGAGASEGEPSVPLRATLVREVGGVSVGIFGVSSMRGGNGELVAGVEETAPMRNAARAAARELREAGADVVIALVRGTRREARQVAGGAEGVDFVVQAGIDVAEAIPPSSADPSWLLHAGRHGQGLLVVDVFRRADGAYTDWSDWTRDVERERIEARIAELRQRIREWEADESVDESDVRAQRRRLEALERELAGVATPRSVEGNAFAARWEELASDAQRAREITALMTAYDRRVNQNNARVFADLAPPPVPEGASRYVGSASCGGSGCHSEALEWWRGHKHGIAYSTLVERNKEFNLSCVGCHVTGYMEPGGATVTHNLDGALVNVGCESCHGPGSAHVERPREAGLVALQVPERVCVECHNAEHSDLFHYPAYRAMLLVPGHGLPSEGASP